MEVQFGYTIIYVVDVVSTIKFYTDAFGFEQKFITPEKDYGELISGSTTLAFADESLAKSNFSKGVKLSSLNDSAFGIELAFVTKDVKAVMQKAITNGASEFEPAIDKPWGQTVGYLRDPNGILIEICTPIH